MKVMCHFCHLHWWHKNPMEAANWFMDKFPERWEYLESSRGIYKWTLTELEDLLKIYTTKLEELLSK